MSDVTCSIEGCTEPLSARGWCRKHYSRWYNHGDPRRVRKLRGRASQYICTECGGPAQQWAYNHRDPDVIRAPMDALLGAGMLYSADPAFYQPMCKRCHSAFDAKHRDSIL